MSDRSLRDVFYFPVVVNDWTARMVALQVVIWTSVALSFEIRWIVPLLAIGFWLRVGWGPRYSPAAKIATKVLVPLLGKEKKPIAGSPKRFAQSIGALLTTSASFALFLGMPGVVVVLMAVLLFFAFLESAFAFCAGCILYGFLARAGVFPKEICVDCVLGENHVHATAHHEV